MKGFREWLGSKDPILSSPVKTETWGQFKHVGGAIEGRPYWAQAKEREEK